ncbi:MAG TPA: hypothetical protein VF092_05010 [Longimicrobium sp.]
MLNPDDLNVESFDTSAAIAAPGGGFCCTGCVSGCGINPTAGGCASASGQVICMQEPVLAY